MRSRTPEDLAGRCRACYLPSALCLCAHVPRVDTRTRFLVLRHNKEAHKSTNTARLAALALPRCHILPYGAPGRPFDASGLDAPGTWLLFPEAPPPPEGTPPPERLVVLDGNWTQARRMYHRLPELRRLPGLGLPHPDPEARRLRRAPHPESMSTLEAMAAALALLEGGHVARPLLALHELMIERVLQSRGRPLGERVRPPAGDRFGRVKERLVFDYAVESMLQVLGQPLPAEHLPRLVALGVDPSKPLQPAYPSQVQGQLMHYIAQRLWPHLPPEGAYFELGREFMRAYRRTGMGKGVSSVTQRIGPHRALERMEGFLAAEEQHEARRAAPARPEVAR